MPVDMKSVIAESLMKLIQRNGLDKVTVKALIEECHISRQTFYYHFQDMMDVLEYIIRQVTRQLEEESLRAETPREALMVFVAFSVERFPMLRRLLDSQRRTQVEQLMLEAVMGYLSTLAQEGPQDLPISMGDREVLLRYNAWWACCWNMPASRIWIRTGWPLSWSGLSLGRLLAGGKTEAVFWKAGVLPAFFIAARLTKPEKCQPF